MARDSPSFRAFISKIHTHRRIQGGSNYKKIAQYFSKTLPELSIYYLQLTEIH